MGLIKKKVSTKMLRVRRTPRGHRVTPRGNIFQSSKLLKMATKNFDP